MMMGKPLTNELIDDGDSDDDETGDVSIDKNNQSADNIRD